MTSFLVHTDNKNFTYFLRTNVAGDSKQGQQIRWQSWFSRYAFTIEHLPGEKNVLEASPEIFGTIEVIHDITTLLTTKRAGEERKNIFLKTYYKWKIFLL